MLRVLLSAIFALGVSAACATTHAREVVNASAPSDVSVTVYRDPERGEYDEMELDFPEGFAMISETRTVTLPPGESRIRFEGVAEGMVAVTAIVTGLPGGTIEKNRDADLLSPAALVDGTLGNRVRITRTNPATGVATGEQAIIRTRADGGIVLQTDSGFEAVRCAGLPEKLSFDRVPVGLSAQPVFSVNTLDPQGGTYQVTLTYLAWGFDWQAHYIARLGKGGAKGRTYFDLFSWLTILNDNGQSFADANLLAVAGTLNVESDFEDLAEPPEGEPIRLHCYPIGSTAKGSPVPNYVTKPYAPAVQAGYEDAEFIVVTGSRVQRKRQLSEVAIAVMAQEEQLGDLKLYRIPERVTVAAKGVKQVAFLDKKRVRGEFLYRDECHAEDWESDWDDPDFEETRLYLQTINDQKHGLGQALPSGGVSIFEPSSVGPLLIAERYLRDHAVTQDVEVELTRSHMVMARCALTSRDELDELKSGKWAKLRAVIRNTNSRRVTVRLNFDDYRGEYEYHLGQHKPRLKDGNYVVDVKIPAGKTKVFDWKIRKSTADQLP